MRLLTSGDSFTKGLIKVPERNSVEEQNKINWPTQLGKLLNTEVINLAQPAAGTDYISYSIQNYLRKTKDRDFFVIAAFSVLERQWDYEFFDRTYFWPAPYYKTENYKELFYKNEMMIRGLHQFLTDEGIPHFFTNSFADFKYVGGEYGTMESDFNLGNRSVNQYWLNWTYDSNTLYNIISENYLEPNPIYTHSTQNELDFHRGSTYIAGCLHPSEEGHKLIAKTFYPYVKKYFTNLI
jgi:lysophospholipase L1-like esterase